MANKIVVVFLMCLVLVEISNIEAARLTVKKSRRERFLCEEAPKAHLYPITEAYKSCFHNCVKPCPYDNEQKFFECELRCDKYCSHKQHRNMKDESEKKNDETKQVSECAKDDVNCLKKCDKNCTKVWNYESK